MKSVKKKKTRKKYKCSFCGERAVKRLNDGFYECQSCGGHGDREAMVEGLQTYGF